MIVSRPFYFIAIILSLLITPPLMSGCTKDGADDYHSGEGMSRGTAYSILADRGGYSLFLQAIDISGYQRLVNGGGLVTVFAPGDEAFARYLEANYGTSDLTAIPKEDVTLIVGYHLIQFAYKTSDFLAFSTKMSEGASGEEGDGGCFHYKSYAREAVREVEDPTTGTMRKIFSREKYIPVFSTRIFSNREIPDAEADYKKLFPTVNWRGADDKLYAGNAAIVESGIPTDNGYLYILDAVSEPLETIDEALNEEWAADYSSFKKLFDHFKMLSYSDALTKSYASVGDSLFLAYHYVAPRAAAEIPEIASEWTYHDENGVAFERPLRYAVNCFAPTNDVVDNYLKTFFSDFGTEFEDDYISLIPNNALYYYLRSFAYDKQDLLLPSEVASEPIVGASGEMFNVSSEEIKTVKMCTNGVIYGINKNFEPFLFRGITKPLFQYSKFSFFSRAIGVNNFDQLVIDANNKYTFFVLDDETLNGLGYSSYENPAPGTFDYKFLNRNQKDPNMGNAAVYNLISPNLFFGQLPTPEEITGETRYFVAKQTGNPNNKTYIYLNGSGYFDIGDNPITVRETYDTENGRLFSVDRFFVKPSGKIFQKMRNTSAEFLALMNLAGLLNDKYEAWAPYQTPSMVFVPTDDAIAAAREAGKFPPVGEIQYDSNGEVVMGGDGQPVLDYSKLRKYLLYYFVPLTKNQLDNYILPGLSSQGVTDEAFSETFQTHNEYTDEADAEYITLGWAPQSDDGSGEMVDSSNVLSLTSTGGETIHTSASYLPVWGDNGIYYQLDECFDYATMFGDPIGTTSVPASKQGE